MIEKHRDELVTIVNDFKEPLQQLVYIDFLYSDERVNKALETLLDLIYTLSITIEDLEYPDRLKSFVKKVRYDLPK